MASKCIELVLESNPSTGYKWIAVQPSVGIQEVVSHYEQTGPSTTPTGELLIGGGGQERFKIWIEHSHREFYHIELIYCRPWEPIVSTIDRIVIESEKFNGLS